MSKDKDKKLKRKYGVDIGLFEDGLPYARIGNSSKIIVNIEALSFKHEPPSGFILKQFVKSAIAFTDDYTLYLIGRKQNLPENYLFDKMAEDYAKMIRREFNGPVDIMGASTGGQIAHYLAANHSDTVRKLILISTAFRLSKRGEEIERNAEEYFRQQKYGKAIAATLDLIISSKIIKSIAKFFIRFIGKRWMGDIQYPNDFLNEVKGDREMDFKERLKEIKAPTLVLSGERDIAYTTDDVRITAEGIPNAKLIIYNGYGHNLIVANRKQIQNDILEFLSR